MQLHLYCPGHIHDGLIAHFVHRSLHFRQRFQSLQRMTITFSLTYAAGSGLDFPFRDQSVESYF